eukprot:TRINITY_DN4929_c1_g1_i1.p1 TRINITY_DN4929_c1_g1~~TRINITY_DN4929_c1_g1_i1.p1  ORF type:complete len:585 (+),score=113.53 TRINITY_DN4929_c1_g1_i1:80-1834(+)
MNRLASVGRRWYRFNDLPVVNHLGLKRVPVPGLEVTMERYLESVKAVVGREEYDEQVRAVGEFINAEGKELQWRILEGEKQIEESGRTEPAFHFQEYWDEMYLGMRCPCPVNSNPYYVFNAVNDSSQASTAARLIYAATSWWSDLTGNTLEPEYSKAGPLCMGTFPYVIATSRIPGETRDAILHCPDSDYVVVFYKGLPYKVEWKGATVERLAARFQSIIDNGRQSEFSERVAVLTSNDRDQWWRDREEVRKDPVSRETIDVIDHALLVVALDDVGGMGIDSVCRSHLVGLPSTLHNRWWDKLMFTIDQSSTVSLIMEHAPADGAYWNSWLASTWSTFEQTTPVTTPQPSTQEKPLPMGPIPEHLINSAYGKNRVVSDSLDMSFTDITDVGSDVIKSAKMPPDAFFQVALQTAYFKFHKEIAPIYESASMRNFWRGRTDNIRGCNTDVVELARKFVNGSPKGDVKAALHKAVARHREITTYTLAGQGIDRHLLSLNRARHDPSPPHPIFTSPAFTKASTWKLSTSNVTSPFLKTFGFGPVTASGYGIGYQLFPKNIPFTVSNYEKAAGGFSSEVVATVHDLLSL